GESACCAHDDSGLWDRSGAEAAFLIFALKAALKRRSSTGLHRSVPAPRKVKIKVKVPILFDSRVDRAGVLFGKAIAHKVVVDPHEPADYPAFIVPPPHHRLQDRK